MATRQAVGKHTWGTWSALAGHSSLVTPGGGSCCHVLLSPRDLHYKEPTQCTRALSQQTSARAVSAAAQENCKMRLGAFEAGQPSLHQFT